MTAGSELRKYADALERGVGEVVGNVRRDAGQALADAETRLATRIGELETRVELLENQTDPETDQ